MKGPYTVHANNLVHLRTDFHFHLSPNHSFGTVLSQLFPTPAVCGMPKEKAQQFILAHEHTPRKYYSGFVVPLHPEGHTHLYVTLRCMQISDGACELYAGGGLLKESSDMKEFEETKQKMQTMFALLR
jgi:isochorismate synthase